MTNKRFAQLLEERDRLRAEHELLCSMQDEESPRYRGHGFDLIRAAYEALSEVEEQIAIELAAERAAEAAQ